MDTKPFQIYYSGPEKGQKTWDHPTLGPLPADWKLCHVVVDKKTGTREPRYWNEKTKKTTTENPRFHAETLKSRQDSKSGDVQTRIATSMMKNSPGLMEKLQRAEIGTDSSLRDQYECVHVIDSGAGTANAIGGSK